MATMSSSSRSRRVQSTLALILAIFVAFAFITRWIDLFIVTGSLLQKKLHLLNNTPQLHSSDFDCSLNCSDIPSFTTTTNLVFNSSAAPSCPDYFRWIHEDLSPWKGAGIAREIVEAAKSVANVRITIVDGRLYVVKYKKAFQTRDSITLWGLLQLLKLYPGRVPDLDLMFEFGDKTVIHKNEYGRNASLPPPVFHYCSDESSYDIVFPDWSFWGWPEVNIKPWEELKEELKEANERIKWIDREPYAYWKGNARLGPRKDLIKCNASNGQDWKARIYDTTWAEEKKQGFNNSDLASQCTHRYKIYVEGVSWSVSQKYIAACDSMTLVIKPHYYDFFTRALLPSVHYWPIGERDKCRAIKSAVEWGNAHSDKAREIGQAGSRFVQESLAMKNIYDYSFHVLNKYAKLLKYKPTVPEGAVEMCSETLVCATKGRRKRFMKHSAVRSPGDSPPCMLPPSYEPRGLLNLLERKRNLTNQVQLWEEQERR
ncbi:uncharacterized protein LOC127244666 [Andrographis paniculata]|uniref:uncharacterized protein LOC127244666 n=1 Tax=Andrographis paniculata TaxID=175694 RepID=UPI0021E96CCB|nr:uncharacterized protein LOC127244666 [Andrographis paniculata]